MGLAAVGLAAPGLMAGSNDGWVDDGRADRDRVDRAWDGWAGRVSRGGWVAVAWVVGAGWGQRRHRAVAVQAAPFSGVALYQSVLAALVVVAAEFFGAGGVLRRLVKSRH
ncbi:hypothetical protein ACQP2X_37325 [Actinoplanes sp. CA-131856]